VTTSHPMFNEVADWLSSNKRDFHKHEGVFLEVAPTSGTLFAACVHNTTRGQAAGGCRYWPYGSFQQYLTDGLRLSQGMGKLYSLLILIWI
jgi:glutamate dehydrogenase/leucine dehydrogenase